MRPPLSCLLRGVVLPKPPRYAELPEEWRASIRAERKKATQAATGFVRVCQDGRADMVELAAVWLDECNAWRPAMAMIGRLERVTREVRDAFQSVWIERKHIPLRVGSRPICAAALRVLMPGHYCGPQLTLYRGTRASERRRHLYGFSWSSNAAIAGKFAERYAADAMLGGGVLLQTSPPAEAILLVREADGFYDEGEVVIDPFRLGKVIVLERLL
jgi:hypothetical protein